MIVVRERDDIGCVVQDRETGIACTVSREVDRGGQVRALARQCVENEVALRARLLDTVKAGTMFSLGHEGDNDRRPYVLVNRQYGLDEWPERAWAVSVVDGTVKMDHRRREFADQAKALEYGWSLLTELQKVSAAGWPP